MYETGLPYVLDPHTLNTLGPENFNGALRLKQFAAHFRIDSQNQVLRDNLSTVHLQFRLDNEVYLQEGVVMTHSLPLLPSD